LIVVDCPIDNQSAIRNRHSVNLQSATGNPSICNLHSAIAGVSA